ncbi:MAG TPA: SPFH domain-containing protein [Ilumatobacteraceae bacterium]|nr:SPFH domain-containing protein [Ilumatobacteraceae bacterium]
MEPAVWIALLVGAVIVLFVVWLVLIETSIRVDPGTLVLLLKRGKATGRALEPGRHFIQPWRKVMVQVYPSRELALLAGGVGTGDTRVDAVDEPLRVHLGDRTFARLSYTVRCQLDAGNLKHVHNQFGPEGIWAALRDTVRRTLIAEAGRDEVSVDDAFGVRFTEFEQRCAKALHDALATVGFELTMFSLREVDLGETGEVIQSTLRADAELEREQAFARVRTARLENDAEMRGLAGDVGDELLLRYRQIEAWRDLLERWDGDRPIPGALTAPLLATSPTSGEVGATSDQHAAEAEQESLRTDTP